MFLLAANEHAHMWYAYAWNLGYYVTGIGSGSCGWWRSFFAEKVSISYMR